MRHDGIIVLEAVSSGEQQVTNKIVNRLNATRQNFDGDGAIESRVARVKEDTLIAGCAQPTELLRSSGRFGWRTHKERDRANAVDDFSGACRRRRNSTCADLIECRSDLGQNRWGRNALVVLPNAKNLTVQT